MIHDLDRTLEGFLRLKVLSPQGLEDQVEISFAPPDDQFQASLGTNLTINLFLYDITENLDLRTQEWHYEKQGDRHQVRTPPPARVDCSYLITVWSSSSESRVNDEHQMLGRLMQTLCRYSFLPKSALFGSLAPLGNSQEDTPIDGDDELSYIPTRTLQAGRLQSIAEFWQAMGGKPKASINYTVTISLSTQDAGDRVRVVDEGKNILEFDQKALR